MLPDPNDRFRPHKRGGALRSLTIGIAVAAVAVFAGLVGYTYMNRGDGPPGVAPLIKADPRPMKTAPDKPGGMEVPHQDKEIYGKLGREAPPQQATRVERLLPPPETPMARPRPPEAPAPLVPQIPPEPMVAPPPGAVEVTQPTTPPPSRPTAAPAQPGAPAAPPATVARAAPPAAATAAAQAVAPSAGGRYRVQLAAVRSNEDAGREWEKMRRAHPDLLGPLAMNVVRADLGDRGTFYRIQAGPLADEATAKELCRRLSEKKMGCLVVRP